MTGLGIWRSGPLLSQGNTNRYTRPMNLILSILMLAGLGLIGGAVVLARRDERKKALLMVIAALVMFANVGIWTLPTASGESPTDILDRQQQP